MDVAYDHIQEEVLSPDQVAEKHGHDRKQSDLNAEFQEAYKSITSSPWGARLGGFFGSVKKQSESYLEEAQKEYSAASEQATRGFTDLRSTLVNRTRGMSLNQSTPDNALASSSTDKEGRVDDAKESEMTSKARSSSETQRDSEGMLARLRSEAAKRLKDIQEAEDAADEALLKFGTNIRNFLRDAVTIAPPTEEKDKHGNAKVLFESRDSEGKRVIHTTRFDAQLHVIHSSPDSFTQDPQSPEFENWKKDFDVEKKTDDVAQDLEKYEELRKAMENQVPEKVQYEQFWIRYYFLRHVVETEERRRKELLKGIYSCIPLAIPKMQHIDSIPVRKGAATTSEEEVAWDEESDDESSTPNPSTNLTVSSHPPVPSISKEPIPPTEASPADDISADSNTVAAKDADSLKPNDPRKSNEHSQADSDASYDLISGATSRAPGSPKEDKRKGAVAEESDEEDWE
ncbi:MAG: hypothetical protein M1827_007633 [Pycnora praestabilis]|nr:MAG: hypothetical protein M1827_007633 [Pycnora praestabilis]